MGLENGKEIVSYVLFPNVEAEGREVEKEEDASC